jgi:hypothetical protein
VALIACIEDQDIFGKILAHLREKGQEAPARPRPTRAPPTTLSLCREGNHVLTVQSAGTPLKTPWHGLLRNPVQEWTDMNCSTTSANDFSV